jgi:hypothetical protein
MRNGLLWFDSTKNKPLSKKVKEAAKRYQDKFGYAATFCFVNTKTVIDEHKVGTVTIETKSTIMPNHLWLGVKR